MLEIFLEMFGFKCELKYFLPFKTDGQAECTIQVLEYIFMANMIDFKGNWDDNLSLIAFPYKKSYHSSIHLVLMKLFMGRRCRSIIGWIEVGKAGLIEPNFNSPSYGEGNGDSREIENST